MNESQGGPAFPVNELHTQTGDVYDQNFGMTLRDYFAARAFPAVIATCHNIAIDDYTDAAYAYADAMLISRAKAQTAQEK